MVSDYVPDAGDLVWINFDPQAGREQAGRRPAFVVTPRTYNERARLMLACPITSRSKGYPFEVPLPGEVSIQGVVLVDHVKSVDLDVRFLGFIEAGPPELLQAVRSRLVALIEVQE